jgi:hypothetical protein
MIVALRFQKEQPPDARRAAALSTLRDTGSIPVARPAGGIPHARTDSHAKPLGQPENS